MKGRRAMPPAHMHSPWGIDSTVVLGGLVLVLLVLVLGVVLVLVMVLGVGGVLTRYSMLGREGGRAMGGEEGGKGREREGARVVWEGRRRRKGGTGRG